MFFSKIFIVLLFYILIYDLFWVNFYIKCEVYVRYMFLKAILNCRGFPGGKEPACECRRCKRCGFYPWVRKIPWRRKWQPTPVFLPGASHGQRRLVGYSPWGLKELDMTKNVHMYICGILVFSLLVTWKWHVFPFI